MIFHCNFVCLFVCLLFVCIFRIIAGISCLPEIQRINLAPIFSNLAKTSKDIPMLCLVLCSDGVWDNWLYEDVKSFVMDVSCLKVVGSNAKGCNKVLKAFMQRNDHFGRSNFGSHADNATGILMYLSNSLAMPHEDIEPAPAISTTHVVAPTTSASAPITSPPTAAAVPVPTLDANGDTGIGNVANMNAITMDSLTAAMNTNNSSTTTTAPLASSSSASDSVARASNPPSTPSTQAAAVTVTTPNSNNNKSSSASSGSPISRSNSNGILSKLASAGAAILGSN